MSDEGNGLKGLLENFINGDGTIWDVLFEPFVSTMGLAAFGLMVSGTSAAALLTWTRSWTLTATWLVLTGGFFVVLLPPAAATVMALLITAMLAISYYSVAYTRVGGR